MEENIKKYIIYSLFPFFSIIFIIYGFFDLEFLQGNNINEYTNDFCQLNCSSIICKNTLVNESCNSRRGCNSSGCCMVICKRTVIDS